MRLGRVRLLASAAAITTLAGAIAAVAVSPAAATATAPVALTSSAASVPAGSVRLGAVPAATKISVDVELNLGNQAGLTALLNGLANPKSPYFHRFLTKGQFGPMFGLSLTQIGQVSATLRSLGLDPGQVDSGRLTIPVTATAAQLEHAFGISLVDYRLPGGRVAYANTAAPKVTGAIAPYVEGVIGLDDLAVPQHMSEQVTIPAKPVANPAPANPAPANPAPAKTATTVPAVLRTDLPTTPSVAAAKGPQACTVATDDASAASGFTATQLAGHYGLTGLYGMGDLGKGVHVAVAELEPNLTSDIKNYETCYGITTPVSYIKVGAGAGTGDGSGEAALDIENIASLAPDVVIDDYQAPNSAASLVSIAEAVAGKDQDQVLSISWGLCEPSAKADGTLLASFLKYWEELDGEGITVASASGDSGSTDCSTAATPSATLAVGAPASTPYGLSVGGSTMQINPSTATITEATWNQAATTANPAGSGGGGLSESFCMPEYQNYHQVNSSYLAILGLISSHSAKDASCKDKTTNPNGYIRQTPDLSANAGAPYIVYYDNAWAAFVGTSASTTIIAADAALIDSSPYCSADGWGSGKVGLLPQGLYAVMSTSNASNLIYLDGEGILQDITSGNNDETASGYTGGLYPATKGYDMASGLGAPLMSGLAGAPAFNPSLASNMCHLYEKKAVSKVSTSSVSPKAGKAGKAITVTIKGSGFLIVPHTDVADVNTKNNTKSVTMVYASCSSHSKCKVTLPAEKAGTYEIEMVVVRWLPCISGCKVYAKFIFSGPPKITKFSPASGAKGTKVTIHGSNFFGVKAVWFGSRKATSVKVISSTEITAVAPQGSGKQKVKVVAAGGTSNQVTFTY